MGAIGGLLGVNGGAGGTGFSGPVQSDQMGMNNLQDSYNRLLQVAQGQGPNPAMAQYNQNVNNLARQQSGALASVQGISPALAARMISQQGSAAMQNAAAQGATAQAEQQLGALGQMGNVANAQANNAVGMQGNINNANSSLANTTMQGTQNAIGGIMRSGGMTGMMAAGGEVPSGPQSSFMKYLSGIGGSSGPQIEQASPHAPANATASAFRPGEKKPAAPGVENAGQGPTAMSSQGMGAGIPYAQPMAAGFSGGGKVPALVSPGEVYIPPGRVKQAAKSENPLSSGKKVPGTPKVPGNSYANDTVPAKLDSGGVVIPNSIMQSKDPAAGAKDLIAGIIAKRKARK